ncbi:MAG: DUF4492 domain-containing protein [Tannerellaceae bacterium]|jgi:hypothetical protein|nr:DUF4492 domain-containing protein [Tannerellaceae bacterium]
MKKESVPVRVFRFYVEGFRGMTLGRTLWLIILIKLFIMFCILKPFFFPRHLGQFKGEPERREYVSDELIRRAVAP